MRLLVFLVLLVLPGVGPVHGNSLSMSLTADGLGGCVLADDSGVIVFYVIHWPSTDAAGVHYRISTCQSTLIWLTDTFSPGMTFTGDSQSGVDVQYPSCLSGPIAVQTVAFFGAGDSPADSGIKLLPHPDSQSGQVEADRCGGGVDLLDAGGVCIRPITCFCNQLGPPYHSIPCLTVPVEHSTWGKVKAMYR